MLGELGLTDDDELTYRELLHGRDSRTLDQTVLRRLVELGFARTGPGGDHRAVPPTGAIRALLHRRRADLHRRLADLTEVEASADELVSGFLATVPGPPPGIEVVVGRQEIARRALGLVAGALHEVLILDRPPYANQGSDGADLDIGAALDRGIAVRVVLAEDGLASPARMRAVSSLIERGLRARMLGSVPTKLILCDRRVAMLPPAETSDPSATALMADDALLRNALLPLFEATWERAVPLGAPGADGPTPEERDLLTLLAAGLKDEVIARHLGVHVHTARRRITRLLHRLDAESRFQAGLQAAVRGWLKTLGGWQPSAMPPRDAGA